MSRGLKLTGYRARIFSGSFESAIYLLSNICSIPQTVDTLPSINSNFTHHISAGLADGTQITGQNSISHPSEPTSLPVDPGPSDATSGLKTPALATVHTHREETEAYDRIEDATLPGSLPTLRKPYIDFQKSGEDDLPARIDRIWYINPYGHEIWPVANPKVISAIQSASAVIYSIGSLYTSIMPSLILRGVGAAIANSPSVRHKIFILNSSLDRETGPSSQPYTATDFVLAIARAAAESQGHTTQLPPEGRPAGVGKYVTHLIHLEGEGTPRVDRKELASLGVNCLRVYGRRGDGALGYDEAALTRALEAVVGRNVKEGGKIRRNTSGAV